MTAKAELSSVATALDELVARIVSIVEALPSNERDSWGSDLSEVERTLIAAQRRLARAVRDR